MLSLLLTRAFLGFVLKPKRASRERGDVPGWVLITVMTAGLVVLIWNVAGQELKQMLERALDSVANR